MRCGFGLLFQNYEDFDRSDRGRFSEPLVAPDDELYAQELALADLAEPLGFDSLWVVEHHFSAYAMTTNPLQLLSYFAGRTSKLDMGSMVCVAPWWDPLRLAEAVTVLDHLLAGRRLSVGLGSGLARSEFESFGLDIADKRDRGNEVVEIVRTALDQEGFAFDGDHFKIPTTSIRPRPRSEDITKNFFFALSSPESAEFIGREGLAPLFTTSADWQASGSKIDDINAIRAQFGWEPVRPVILLQVYCTKEPGGAEKGKRHVFNYQSTAVQHYRMLESLPATKREAVRRPDGSIPTIEELGQQLCETYASNHVFGTPAECIEKIRYVRDAVGAGEFIFMFRYADVTAAEAEASARLFAAEVLPAIQALEGPDRIEATPFHEVQAARRQHASLTA